MSDGQILDEPQARPASLKGAELIRGMIARLPQMAGVYRMLDARGEPIYVGKAKSLKKRVAAYTVPAKLTSRLQRMVALTRGMEFVTCTSEVEALLLEANMIKRYRPVFNIVLRDDKSFPYIYLRHDHDWAMIGKQRGAKRAGRDYFGPFASATAVNDTLGALLRAFPLRSCSDSIFASRSRPCLKYQIKRCTAPCVGRISADDYALLVEDVRDFLEGRSTEVQAALKAKMEEAAERLDFETAAIARDRLKALAHIQARQGINTDAVIDADVVAVHREGGEACVQVFFYRGGRNYGNKAYYPAHTSDGEPGEILQAFLAQFYDDRLPPRLLLLSDSLPEQALLAEALSSKIDRKVEIAVPQRGAKTELVEIARSNARDALARKLAESDSHAQLLRQLAARLGLSGPPARIEVYDNSHIQGRDAVGAFIVAGAAGLERKHYRTFKIKDEAITGGDDFAMMREVLGRRFARLKAEDPSREGGSWPDLVVIDGGAGQLGVARTVLDEAGLGDIALLGVAKGPERHAGRERFFMVGREPFSLEPQDPVLYLVQRLRDEAHRFVINAHRARRSRSIERSVLDEVTGIGSRRKKALLQHFGSARGVAQAGLRDLEQVPGISKSVARAIYEHFHETS